MSSTMAGRFTTTEPGMKKQSSKSSAWVLQRRPPPSRSNAMEPGASRRSFLAAIGGLPALALQQPTTPRPWSKEYWAQKSGVRLYLFRKRRNAPRQGEQPLPVLLLVHGSSLSGRSTFDLEVPAALGDYSMMNAFAGFAFDVWTIDF